MATVEPTGTFVGVVEIMAGSTDEAMFRPAIAETVDSVHAWMSTPPGTLASARSCGGGGVAWDFSNGIVMTSSVMLARMRETLRIQ